MKFNGSKVTLIGCPKLDDIDYSEKLTTIISNNDIQSVTIVVWKFRAVAVWSLQQRKHCRQAANLFRGR